MDLKTTITGIVTGVLGLLAAFGVVIPEQWSPIIIAVGVAVVGFFARDGGKKE